jgi:hypothetical protein
LKSRRIVGPESTTTGTFEFFNNLPYIQAEQIRNISTTATTMIKHVKDNNNNINVDDESDVRLSAAEQAARYSRAFQFWWPAWLNKNGKKAAIQVEIADLSFLL